MASPDSGTGSPSGADTGSVPVLDTDGVRLTVDDSVATVTLTVPAKLNAQNPALWRALAQAGRSLPGSVRVVILRGEGKSFSAGLDRQAFTPEGFDGEASFFELAKGTDAELDAAIAGYQEAFTWWRRPDLVSIAAVQGHAIGAGFQLALACDLRVVAEDVQFAMRETSLGLVPDLAGSHPLVGLVGQARALEICLTGRYVHAAEAERIGLANLVVPAGQLDGAVRDLAAALLAAPRDAVNETKALLQGAQDRSYDEQRAAERAAQARRLRDLAGIGD
ncbi:enoyl-CoA hydratase/isomerase family protein [Streptomyces tsukubensis]|uniref:Enoyl-CoA hydratase n=1 Tax=Streptomyces tsukubensis TaxID=83656 RepID=A0A1V4A3I7_9ACTN|nr:enoyl-CoA hydratase/isomerase family protein [Streptomyces tsukubensis]OON74009.1 enoyl-CoA hydratase [Streptomyces tsukubensis]QFR92945.1 enoyl-CoA hydratase/isomerase family protein [Streptomyces tsukubensis]